MTYFKWTRDIELGHPEIDKQHKRLFVLGEAVVESMVKSGEHKLAAEQLQEFIVFAQEHFKYEEGLMRLAGYPDAERHARDHASLLIELIRHCEEVLWGKNAKPAGLNRFLWNWLILHIDITDRELAVWLKSHKPAVTDAAKGSSKRRSKRGGPAASAAI